LILYLDTSVLVAVFTPEADSGRVVAWMSRQAHEDFAVSDWVVTEFSAALSVKLRRRQIAPAHQAAALARFGQFCADNASVLPVVREHFQAAAEFADRYAIGLRAGDALHLAITAEHGAILCTLDRRLGEAGPRLGIATIPV
jgi:predicted nucleic acid-binding protein